MGTYDLFDVDLLSGLTILIGGFGSGKTEIALSSCFALVARGCGVTLVDIDLVKPLFRARGARRPLLEQGVRTISSMADMENADMPALSPEVEGAMASASVSSRTIVDVGGDETGATALGRFRHTISATGYDMVMVVNPYRPFTRDISSVAELIRAIGLRSRLEVTGIISNPNLGSETEARDIREGHELVRRMSEAVGLPIRFIAIWEELLARRDVVDEACRAGMPVFPVQRYMLPPWVDKSAGAEEG